MSFNENFEKGISFSPLLLLSIVSLRDNVLTGSAALVVGLLSLRSIRLNKIYDVVDIINAVESISGFCP
jgi:hypothetical protein